MLGSERFGVRFFFLRPSADGSNDADAVRAAPDETAGSGKAEVAETTASGTTAAAAEKRPDRGPPPLLFSSFCLRQHQGHAWADVLF